MMEKKIIFFSKYYECFAKKQPHGLLLQNFGVARVFGCRGSAGRR